MSSARAVAVLSERQLAGRSAALQRAIASGSAPRRTSAASPRSISTGTPVISSRLSSGSRYTVSRNHRGPNRAAPHASNHASEQTTPQHVPPVQPTSTDLAEHSTSRNAEQAIPSDAASNNIPTDPSVHITAVVPHEPRDVLQSSEPNFSGATRLLSQSALVVTREVEMMNIFLGFEQANKYSIHAPSGELVGYLAEEEQGLLGGALQRQVLRTHRPFRATVMDAGGKPVLMIRRPFTWINSTAHIYAVRRDYPVGYGAPQEGDLELIGEVQQRWHLYKRRYELFLRRREEGGERFVQFAGIDGGFLTWTFLMQDADSKLVGSIDRSFRGFGREIFTDTGQYVLRFDSVGETAMTDARLTASSPSSQNKPTGIAEGLELVKSHGTRPLTLDERAVALATAVSIDFDYFSRHSEGMHGGGGMLPWMMMPGMGGGGGGEAAETPRGGPNNENVPQNPNAGDDGFGAGVAGGAIGSGMDYPYGASESGMSEDGRLSQPPSNPNDYGQPPPQEQGESPWWNAEQQQQEAGEVWGEGGSDPWAGAGDTQTQDQGFWGGWGGGGGDNGGGGGWGGFFGGDGDGGGGDW